MKTIVEACAAAAPSPATVASEIRAAAEVEPTARLETIPPSETLKEACRRAAAEERERMRRIMQSTEAEGRGELARRLATTTDIDPETAIALLKSSPRRSERVTSPSDQFSERLQQLGLPGAPTNAPLH